MTRDMKNTGKLVQKSLVCHHDSSRCVSLVFIIVKITKITNYPLYNMGRVFFSGFYIYLTTR